MYVPLAQSGLGSIYHKRVRNLLPARRGIGDVGLGWGTYPYWDKPADVYVQVPQPAPFPPTPMPTAETSVAVAADQLIKGAALGNLSSSIYPPDYATPAALRASLVEYAKNVCTGNSWVGYTCKNVDPVALGNKYADKVLAAIKTMPLNSSSNISVYDYWVNGVRPATPPPSQPKPTYTPAPLPANYTPVVSVPVTQPAPIPNHTPVYQQPGAPPVGPSSAPASTPPSSSSSTGSPAASSAPSSLIPAAASTWISDHWLLLAAGAVALVALPALMEKGHH